MKEAIDRIARATVAATPEAQRHRIGHIDTAQSFALAAEFMEDAALLVAKGAPADCPEVSRYIRWGLWKAQEGTKLMSDAAKGAGETGAGEALQ